MPAGPSLSCLPVPLCHACRPLPVIPAGSSLYACRPFSVMPVGPPLSFPQFLAGIQSKQSFSRVQSGSHIPLTRRAWTPSRCRTLNAEKVRQGTTLDSRLQTSGMTGDLLLGITEGVLFVWERGVLMTCVMRTMRQPAFFRRIAIIPPVPFLSLPSAPLSCPPALPVMPAGPFLLCPLAPLCHSRSF